MKYYYHTITIVFSLLLVSCKTALKEIPNGIGSIKSLELGTINDSIAMEGKYLFDKNCISCHTMEYQSKGPDLSDILSRRKPEWTMNFLMNAEIMQNKEATAHLLDKKYKLEDCNVKLSEMEARKVLEYLRLYQLWLHEFNVK